MHKTSLSILIITCLWVTISANSYVQNRTFPSHILVPKYQEYLQENCIPDTCDNNQFRKCIDIRFSLADSYKALAKRAPENSHYFDTVEVLLHETLRLIHDNKERLGSVSFSWEGRCFWELYCLEVARENEQAGELFLQKLLVKNYRAHTIKAQNVVEQRKLNEK